MTSRNPQTLMALPNEESFDFLFKVVLIGDCGTGKTCIVERFKTGNFIERHGNTIGVDFSMKTVNIEGKQIKVCKVAYVLSIIKQVYRYIHIFFVAPNLGYCWSGTFSNNYSELLSFCKWSYNWYVYKLNSCI